MYKLSQQYGAACGAGQRWIPQSQSGGYCAPEGSSNLGDLPKTEDFAKGKSCSRAVTAAKGPGGVCSAYPTDCVPPGWTSASTCVETPRSETTGGQFGQAVTKGATSCPSNAHFVAVPFDPNGGYCIPNYTSTQTAITGNNATGATFTESSCSSGYHRNYPGGPCLQDYGSNRTGIASLPPLTSTPGNYPSPTYPTRQCGPGSRFVSDPFGGGYCAPDNYPGPGSSGGTGGTASCTQPAGGCPSGWSWNQSACSCLSTSGKAADSATCKPPSGGCPGGWNWNQNNCSCVSNSYQPSSSGTSIPYSGSTSPSGYGSCPSGMSWNGSYCTGTYTGGTSGGSSGGTYTGSGTSGGTYSGSGTQTSGGNYQPPSGGSSGTYQAPQPYYSQPPTQTTTTTSPPPSETSSSSPPPSSEPSSSSPPPTESTSSSPPPSTTTTSGCGGGSGIPC